jgi:hypothetical protein
MKRITITLLSALALFALLMFTGCGTPGSKAKDTAPADVQLAFAEGMDIINACLFGINPANSSDSSTFTATTQTTTITLTGCNNDGAATNTFTGVVTLVMQFNGDGDLTSTKVTANYGTLSGGTVTSMSCDITINYAPATGDMTSYSGTVTANGILYNIHAFSTYMDTLSSDKDLEGTTWKIMTVILVGDVSGLNIEDTLTAAVGNETVDDVASGDFDYVVAGNQITTTDGDADSSIADATYTYSIDGKNMTWTVGGVTMYTFRAQ